MVLTSAMRPGPAPLALGHARHVDGDHAQQATEYKGDNCNDDQLGQLGVDELLAVGNPFVQHLAQEAVLPGTQSQRIASKKVTFRR